MERTEIHQWFKTTFGNYKQQKGKFEVHLSGRFELNGDKFYFEVSHYRSKKRHNKVDIVMCHENYTRSCNSHIIGMEHILLDASSVERLDGIYKALRGKAEYYANNNFKWKRSKKEASMSKEDLEQGFQTLDDYLKEDDKKEVENGI